MEELSKFKLRKIVLQAHVTSARRRRLNTRITVIVPLQQESKELKAEMVKVRLPVRVMVNR